MEALMGDLLSNVDWTEIGWASWDTLVMVGMSLLFSVLIGLPVGVLLFLFGSGPVRGFAVVLVIGLFTSVFTAVTLTRMWVAGWLRTAKPKDITL